MKNKIIILLIFILFAGCSGGSAKELFETAEFEELQNNHAHAMRLYEEIVREYPDSDYTKRAKERIAELKK